MFNPIENEGAVKRMEREKLIKAAIRRYAERNRSDPFAARVALSRIRNGILDPEDFLRTMGVSV